MKTNTTNGQFRHRSAEERKRIVQHPMHTSWRFVSSSKTVRLEGVCGESETPTAALRARWPNIVASHTGHASSAKREISNSGPGKACRSAPCQIAEHRGTPYWSRDERKKREAGNIDPLSLRLNERGHASALDARFRVRGNHGICPDVPRECSNAM